MIIIHRTLFIKKCSLKSLNASDRPRSILINSTFVFLKVDNFHQLRIQVSNRDIRQDHFKTLQQRAITSHLAHQSAITYDFHLSDQNCRAESAHSKTVEIIKIDLLSQ